MCHRDPVEVKKLRIQLADLQQTLKSRDEEIERLKDKVDEAEENCRQMEEDRERAQEEVDRLSMKLNQRTPRAYSQAAALITSLKDHLLDEVEVCGDPGHRHRLFDVLQEKDYRLGDAVYSVDRALTTGDESWLRTGPGADLPRKQEKFFPPYEGFSLVDPALDM